MIRIIKKTAVVMTLTLFLFLLLTLLIPYLQFGFADDSLKKDQYQKIKIIAHRGLSARYPENTLASFAHALDTKADILELDVHLSSDDSLIVMHDHSVNRTTGGKGYIRDLAYQDIKKLDAGSWFSPDFHQEKVPTLAEVFELVQGRKTILIELKWPRQGVYPNLVQKVVELIRRYHAESWTIIQSFEPKYLEELHQLAPDLTAHQLVFGFSSFLPLYFDRTIHFGRFHYLPDIKSINCFYLYANKKALEKYHARNLTVFVFTIDDEKRIRKAANLGVDGIITNDADSASKFLGRN